MNSFIVEHYQGIFLYLFGVNLLALILFGVDKAKACRGQWRIREANLFIFPLLGGALGAILGMKVFHHKTMHKKFCFGLPVIILLHLFLLFSYLAALI